MVYIYSFFPGGHLPWDLVSYSRPYLFGLPVGIYLNKVVKILNLNLEDRGIVRQEMFSSRSIKELSEMWQSSIGTALKNSGNTVWNATKLTKTKTIES